MKRILLLATLSVLLVAVLLDPYTLLRSGSDSIAIAPWWQLTLGVVDVVLLILVGAALFRGSLRGALNWLSVESIYHLSLGIGFLALDGRRRFFFGYNGVTFLAVYLAAVAVRIAMLAAMAHPETLTGQGQERPTAD